MRPDNIFRAILFSNVILTCFGSCRDITKCTASIADEALDTHQTIAVLWGRSDTNYVTSVLRQFHGPAMTAPILQLTRKSIRRKYTELRYRQLLFIATNPEEFRYYLSIIQPHVITPFRTVLLLSTPLSNQSELTRVMEVAWEYDVGDIIVLSTDASSDTVKVSTYFPYGKGKCGDVTPVALDITSGNFFPRKFNNFNRCPIKVTVSTTSEVLNLSEDTKMFPFNRHQGELLAIILEALNASLKIVKIDEGNNFANIYPNGTATGVFRDIVERKADILLPTRIANPIRYEATQETPSLHVTYMYWAAPARREIYSWAKAFLPFFSNISPLILLSFILFFITVKFVLKYSLRYPKKNRKVLFQIFAMFLGKGVKFETSCWLVNSIFVLWIWYCLIISAAYQGDLMGRMHEVILEPPLKTLQEAIQAVNGWGGLPVLRDLYKDRPIIYKKYQSLNHAEELFYFKEICSKGKRFLIILNDGIHLGPECHKNVQVLDDSGIFMLSYVPLRPGWPAADEVRKVILRIIESGIFGKLKKDDLRLHERDVTVPANFDKTHPLIISFCGLLLAHLICFIIFIGEIVINKYKLNKISENAE